MQLLQKNVSCSFVQIMSISLFPSHMQHTLGLVPCSKVMFSHTCVCLSLYSWGSHVTNTHNALALTVQALPPLFGVGISLYSDPFHVSDIWWSSLETLFTLGHHIAADIWWLFKHVRLYGRKRVVRILLECFLVYFIISDTFSHRPSL